MDILSRELDRQKLDQKIRDAIEVVRKLRTCRNTLAPISRIPTEILSRIFTTLARSCFDDSSGSDLSWISSTTAVCGHWRAIALECPSLWCFIGFRYPIWIEEMLRRSKMAPLYVGAIDSYLSHKMIDAVHLALQHLSRIQELHINSTKVILKKLFDHIDERAPLLRYLCLSNDSFIGSTNDMYTLPETLFVTDGHHLERLDLVDCIISWDSPLLHNLIHFELINSLNVAQPTITQLLDALERMPLLETLDLERSLPAVSGDGDFRIVHLSYLKTLRLSSTTIKCEYLLDHITYPASTSLCFDCTGSGLPTLFKAISSVWNGKDGSKLLRSLSIDRWTMDSVKLRGWVAHERLIRDIFDEPAQIDISLHSAIGERKDDDEMMINICNALTLTDLCALSVNITGPIPKVSWLNISRALMSLRAVFVQGPAVIGFVSALSTGWEENASEGNPSSGDTGKIFLPNLHDLWLEGWGLSDTMTFEFFEDLRDCLMKRYHWNAEVQRLCLQCTEKYSGQVELLKEIVVDVSWMVMQQELHVVV